MLLYYHGSDTFRLREAISGLAARAGECVAIDLATEDQRLEFERLLKYPSFFGDARLLIAQNICADANTAAAVRELMERYAVPTLSDVTVCAYQEEPSGRESAASKQLTAYLQKHAHQQEEFTPLNGTRRAQWVRERCGHLGRNIEPAALSELIERTRENTWALSSELSKLCAFADEDGAINVQAVRQLVPAAQEHDEWELSNALANNNKREAVTALFRRLMEGTPEQLLLGSLAASIRTLLTVKDLTERGMTAGTIAKTAGLHPYIVTKTLPGASRYATHQLQGALERLAWLDRAHKDGRADATDGLYQVLLAL